MAVAVSADIPYGPDVSFAVDNINVSLDIVPPQSFAVSLPASIANGQPTPGAGDLETAASEDDYTFTTAAADVLVVDFSNCSNSTTVDWTLVNTDSGQIVESATNTCWHQETASLPPGDYELKVTPWGSNSLTYNLDLFEKPAPQVFDVSLPVLISNGQPSTGAGDLETTASEDDYDFTTSSTESLVFDFSNCTGYAGAVNWTLVDVNSGSTVSSKNSDCGHDVLSEVPAGSYQLEITQDGYVTTYALNLYTQPTPQSFPLFLPATVEPGVPASGAGDLESDTSEDDYYFELGDAGSLVLDVTDCSAANGIDWVLVSDADGSQVGSANSDCGHHVMTGLSSGGYELEVTPGAVQSGTYSLSLFEKPAPQVFNVSLPAAISNGQPSTGAGDLETTASEDDYDFTTSSSGSLVFDFSSCTGYAGSVNWTLTSTTSGSTVSSKQGDCGHDVISNLPAGSYQLAITQDGYVTTYALNMFMQPAPQSFAVSLPASIANGQPATGAGNLETDVSEDDYTFTTTAADVLVMDFSNCSGGNTVDWAVVNTDSGQTVKSGTNTCYHQETASLPAADYELRVTPWALHSFTYNLSLFEKPAPQVFNVSLPASVSNGQPSAGAGPETTASEDDYDFTTSATENVILSFSSCTGYAGSVNWTLVNTTSGSTVSSKQGDCGQDTISNVPAGSYQLAITQDGYITTYSLGISAQPPPQSFAVSLPGIDLERSTIVGGRKS